MIAPRRNLMVASACGVFAGLMLCAVLTQLEDKPGTHVSRLVVERVREALGQSLPANLADRIQVRAYQVPSKSNGQS